MDFTASVLTMAMVYVLATLSMNIVQGEAGIFTIAQTAFVGIGAFTTAALAVKAGFPILLTFPLAAIAGLFVSAIVFFPVARLVGLVQVLITFAFVAVMQNVFEAATPITNGNFGIAGIPQLSVGGIYLGGTLALLISYVVITCVVIGFLVLLKRSPYGLVLRAARECAPAARAGARSVVGAQFGAFVIGGAIAGLAGSMYAVFIGYVDPTPFSLDTAFLVVAMLVLGGSGNIAGAIVGAVILSALPSLLTFLPVSSAVSGAIDQLLYAAAILVVIRVRPRGLIPERIGVRWEALRKRNERDAAAQVKVTIAGDGSRYTDSMGAIADEADHRQVAGGLQVSGIRRAFGGLAAVDGVSFELALGERLAIIGANGAGKTTLVNCLTGFDQCDAGETRYGAVSLNGMRPEKVARAGLCRTFQDVKLFEGLTVTENLLVYALPGTGGWLPFAALRGRRGYPVTSLAKVARTIDRLGLEEKADSKSSGLSYGQQKLVALGRILCASWGVLVLDEPMAGLSAREIEVVVDLVEEAADAGRAVILIEHNMDFVFKFASRIIVMDRGRVIADGTPSEVREDRLVRSAYLGGSEDL